jgi:hypothetical protein
LRALVRSHEAERTPRHRRAGAHEATSQPNATSMSGADPSLGDSRGMRTGAELSDARPPRDSASEKVKSEGTVIRTETGALDKRRSQMRAQRPRMTQPPRRRDGDASGSVCLLGSNPFAHPSANLRNLRIRTNLRHFPMIEPAERRGSGARCFYGVSVHHPQVFNLRNPRNLRTRTNLRNCEPSIGVINK